MKRQFLLLIAIALFATALATNASGQTTKTAKANVKFDFQIGDRIYPAGEYWFESISLQANLLRIRNVNEANKSAFILANHSNLGRGSTPRLVFQRYGKDYFLSQIFLDTQEWGYSIRPSRRQREGEKVLALVSLEKN